MNISEALILYRRRKKLTQAQLAEELGVTRYRVINWEMGRKLPPHRVYKLIEGSVEEWKEEE